MARHWRISAALALCISGATLSLPAHAQSASEIAAAKQWFTEGLALEEKGSFADALERFQRALEVKKTPQIQFHVGLCQLKTGALVEAMVSLGRATELAKAEGNDQVVSAADAELAALRPRVPYLELGLKGTTKPSEVSLDGAPLSAAAFEAPIPVNPGSHQLLATFETGQVKRSFKVAERERAKVELEAPAGGAAEPVPPPVAPTSAPAPTPAPPPVPDKPAQSKSNVLPWVFVGTGAVATVAGFYMWKLRGDKKSELDSICPTETSCPKARASDVDSLESSGKTYNTLAIGFWGLGAAALATGGYLLLSESKSEKSATRIAPSVGPGVAGAFVSGAF
jgi:tetratricopeptide (TPR) repeat protein